MDNEELKGFSASALGGIGPDTKHAVPLIAALLRSPNITRRRAAAEALGQIGTAASDSISMLIEAYYDHSFHDQAKRCLIPRFEEPAFPEFSRHPGHLQIDIALALWRIRQDPTAIELLIERLDDDYSTVRMRGIDVLRAIVPPDERIVTEFIRLTKDPILFVRCHAAKALAMSGTTFSSILPALIAVLADENPSAQFQAAKALGSFGTFAAPATAALEQMLHVPYDLVRSVAAGALWRITRREEAMTILIDMVKERDSRLAASELGEIGPEACRAIPALLMMRNSADLNVHHKALEALAQIAGPPDEN
jgi:HEAT repeat protein